VGVSGQLHIPAALPPGKEPPGTHCIGGWVGPRVSLDVVKRKNHRPCQESDLFVQPVGSISFLCATSFESLFMGR